ncbi:iron-sulfur cofactor synthesis protein [Clostridium sp. CAG:221]|uniref:cysteine desulfurase family protein n=1 Tax=Clostridium sp. CAG:221 TaxID=1262780 RepID=UPI00033C0FFC|nr:cysteine desulfurase family protein [Clostridium sp. CAG:221]CDB14752.1 iron-sulfur cofactor synthesis protein [Clostridium sp. CAG:221]
MEIYFDNSATTKPYDEVIEETCQAMKEYYGNPSSLHNIGLKCEKRLNEAREYFASTIKADKDEIYFTSGGSEGNNFVLKGLLKPGHHLITTAYEHQSVLDTCKVLENNGVKVTYLPVDKTGRISLGDLDEAITKDTVLVSIMHINNEVGTIQDLEAIGKIIKSRSSRAKFHVDGVQSYGKISVDVKKMNIDYFTAASHKIHGPKGTGFVYIKKGAVINSLISGGSQERGFRAGTQNLPSIIGFEKAAKMTFNKIDENYNSALAIKKYMIERLQEIKDIRINSPLEDDFSPYILNVSFIGARAEVLLHLLEDAKIYVATGSACTSKSSAASGSYVIKALGLNNKEVESAIRFSFDHNNTKKEVDKVIEVLKTSLMFLRRVRK